MFVRSKIIDYTMRKYGIPSTTTSTTQASTTTSTTTTIPPCVNPLLQLVSDDILSLINVNEAAVENAIRSRLDKGIVLNPNCNKCCPDCGDFYSLSAISGFGGLAEQPALEPLYPCCLDYVELEPIFAPPPFDIPIGPPIPCPSSPKTFDVAIQNIITEIGTPAYNAYLLPDGIIEYSSLGKSSGLYVLVQAILASSYYSPVLLLTVIKTIRDRGVVVFCAQGTHLTSSIETFYKYIEPVG